MYLSVARDELVPALQLTGWALELDTAAAQPVELVADCIVPLQELVALQEQMANWALHELMVNRALQEQMANWALHELMVNCIYRYCMN